MNLLTKVLILSLLLTGCAAQQEAPKEVYIPVVAPVAEPPIEEQPFLPIWLLKETDSTDYKKIARYYSRSLMIQRAHSDKLQCALDAYRVTTPKQCKEIVEPIEYK
jgi:PBP1b-binding outer membrane lipoprotein LpoB